MVDTPNRHDASTVPSPIDPVNSPPQLEYLSAGPLHRPPPRIDASVLILAIVQFLPALGFVQALFATNGHDILLSPDPRYPITPHLRIAYFIVEGGFQSIGWSILSLTALIAACQPLARRRPWFVAYLLGWSVGVLIIQFALSVLANAHFSTQWIPNSGTPYPPQRHRIDHNWYVQEIFIATILNPVLILLAIRWIGRAARKLE